MFLGEESAEQIKLRADRLNVNKDNLLFLAETDIDNVELQIEKLEPEFVIIDSIQTMYSEEISSSSRKCFTGKRNYSKNYEDV